MPKKKKYDFSYFRRNPDKARLTVYLPKEVVYNLRVAAARKQTSVTALVEGALRRDKRWDVIGPIIRIGGNKQAQE